MRKEEIKNKNQTEQNLNIIVSRSTSPSKLLNIVFK